MIKEIIRQFTIDFCNICQKMRFNYVGREEKISSSLKTKGEKAQRILSKSGTRSQYKKSLYMKTLGHKIPIIHLSTYQDSASRIMIS